MLREILLTYQEVYLEFAPLVVLGRVSVGVADPHAAHQAALVRHLDAGDLADGGHHLGVGAGLQLVPDVLAEHQQRGVVAAGLAVVGEGHGGVRGGVREYGAH